MEKREISTEEALQKLAKRDRYLGVLWEQLGATLSVILGGNNVLEAKIDRVDAKLENFKTEANEKFGMLFEGQDELKNGQKVLESGMKQLLEDNQDFFTDMRDVRVDIKNLESRVTALEA